MTTTYPGGRKPAALERKVSDRPLFSLGQLVATPGALETMEKFQTLPLTLIRRHVRGDFGDLCAADQEENWLAIEHGFRVFSAYELTRLDSGRIETEKLWVITECDRSVTTVLCPSEY